MMLTSGLAEKTPARSAAEEALLDAAERLLVEVGYAGITTRRLAEAAGVNHGLVHYYFGSNENLLVRALERFTERLIARQRELYAADLPFVEKWRTAMRYLVSEDVTYEKIWLELQALAWNNAGPARARRARERRVARRADRGLRGAAPRARDRHAARGARLARHDVQHRDHRRAPRRDRRRATPSSSTGSTDGCRADRAARPSRRGRATPTSPATSSATACGSTTRSTASGEPTVLLHADVVDHPLAPLEDADPVPRAPLPRRHVRRARQRPLRPAARAGRVPRGGVRRRRARGDGRDRHRARRAGLAVARARERSLLLAAEHPERVEKLVFIAPALPLPPVVAAAQRATSFEEPRDEYEGWGEVEPPLLARALRGLPRVLLLADASRSRTRRSSVEDAVGWGLETDAETLVATQLAPRLQDEDGVRELLARVDCPVLVIHGDGRRRHARASRCAARGARGRRARRARGLGPPPARARPGQGQPAAARLRRAAAPADALGARQVAAQARALRLLADRARPRAARRRDRRRAAQAPSRPRDRLARAAPGHRRARGARRADPPGERATSRTSRRHIESESAEHDLHCFQAIRRMDEILLANFMVFHDLVRDEQYDLWIGDEAWELDYYLHENPEQKRAAYVWLTDFVGWLPMDDGGEREAFLTADYNAEMIEHIARFPRLRDRARLRRQPRRHRARRVRPGPAADPRLDASSTTTSPATSPASTRATSATAARRARLPRRRAGLHRHRRRLGRRRRTCCAA